MKNSSRTRFSVLLVMLLLMTSMFAGSALGNEADAMDITGDYQMVVEGYDWGPGVCKIILSLNTAIEADSVDAADFSVVVTKQALDWQTFQQVIVPEPRNVLSAYASGADGVKVDGSSTYIALELEVDPNMGNPFFFTIDLATGAMGNSWADPYTHEITYNLEGSLKAGAEIKSFTIDPVPTGKMLPLTEKFDLTGTFTASNGIALAYASYVPAIDAKRPLVIWLHGAGEGGTDPSVIVLGNRVTKLVDEDIQGIFGEAYILAPQSPTMWMDAGDAKYTTNGDSIYVEALMELIDSYITSTPGIDTDRIYIGGCSNGGFMTMKMILSYPEYFTAAYPVCEALMDEWITDAQIESIVNLPIWLTQAKSDDTVAYDKHALPTYERLVAAGAKDVHLSLFDNVVDTSGLYKDENGEPYEYTGHWSWVYTLKNECVETVDGNDVTIMEWLASKTK